MCLRVPYNDEETGGVGDVSLGTLRRLITPSGACGKLWYMSPEVVRNEGSFDGFAIDLWAAGVILFIMLVGRPPWPFASMEVPEFREVAVNGMPDGPIDRLDQCGVGRLAIALGKPDLSLAAADLLQKMLSIDPRQRLSLAEIQGHPWVQEAVTERQQEAAPQEEWRDSSMIQ